MTGRMGVSRKRGFSSGMAWIAGAAIALAVVVLVLTRSIINGFQKVIPDKITFLWGDVQCVKLDLENGLESAEIKKAEISLTAIAGIKGVEAVNKFTTKAAIAKTEEEFEGVVWWGMDDPSGFFYQSKFLKKGRLPLFSPQSEPSYEVLISERLARRLKVKLGDKLPIYLVQNPPRARALTVTGLYTSGLETELGREVIFGDMKPIVKLNQWDNQSFGGVKVKLKPGASVSLIQQQLRKISGSEIQVETIQDRFPNLLSWLSLFDVNEQVLMIVLLAVVGINILSALLVLIVERTRLAALLNVMGASPGDIRKLFLGFGIRLVFKGLLIGNLLAGMLFLAQKQFSLIRLDEAVYYVSAIPLNISAKEWLMLNFWMFLASCLVLIVPTTLIQRIKPAQALRFS